MNQRCPRLRRTGSSRRREAGATTLLIASVLFLVALLVMLYVNRGAVMEQRMSANERRAKEAFVQATAGIDHALAYMRDGGIDHDNNNSAEAVSGGRYRAIYCSTTAEPPACPTTFGAAMPACTVAPTNYVDVLALSCGWSDDNSAVQRVVQQLRGSTSTAGIASTPLVSKGTTDLLNGGASIFNYFNDLTVWSGGPTVSASATGKTFIKDGFGSQSGVDFRATGNSPGCNNPPAGYTCSTNGTTIGHDVVMGDTSLSMASNEQYFARFFGKTPDDYKAGVVTDLVAPADIGTINDAKDQVIWVTGDVTIGSNMTIGTADRPVILIVEGVLTFTGSPIINGLVYTLGGTGGTGSPTIYGSLIVNGAATGSGNVKIIYDPNVLGKVSMIGKAAKVAGTFRDW